MGATLGNFSSISVSCFDVAFKLVGLLSLISTPIIAIYTSVKVDCTVVSVLRRHFTVLGTTSTFILINGVCVCRLTRYSTKSKIYLGHRLFVSTYGVRGFQDISACKMKLNQFHYM